MVQDLSQSPGTFKGFRQAVAGLTPPQGGEARIREVFPTVMGTIPAAAILAKKFTQSYFLTPIGLLIVAPAWAIKFAPFICRRYTLTNRRLAIRKGLKPAIAQEVALADIDDVKLDEAAIDSFYLSGTLEIISKGSTVMTLTGVPEPESFRQAILNAVKAWVPGRAQGPWQAASASG